MSDVGEVCKIIEYGQLFQSKTILYSGDKLSYTPTTLNSLMYIMYTIKIDLICTLNKT